jgi:hypothetical protein
MYASSRAYTNRPVLVTEKAILRDKTSKNNVAPMNAGKREGENSMNQGKANNKARRVDRKGKRTIVALVVGS